MAGLKDILKLNSTAEQLFLWSVLSPLVNELLAPFIRELEYLINAQDPNVLLTPAELADMVNRGHIDRGSGAEEAVKAGIASDRFDRMVRNAGEPPGPESLAEALRRGIIPRDAGNDAAAGYIQGILQSRLQNQWAPVIEALDERLPGPSAAVLAFIRSMRSESDARALYRLFGGAESQFQLEADITGEGPTPVEAGVLLNRRIIQPSGTGADSTSFAQAIAESRFKNKWAAAYDALRSYRPPPRTVTAMFREGVIDSDTATRYLQDYGVPQEALHAYLNKATRSGVQHAHSITEAEIIRLYTERGIDVEKTTALLTGIGYNASDAALIIAGADLEYQKTLSQATIAAVKALYLHRHLTVNEAITRLDNVGVKSTYRDSLIELWDLEIQAGVKSLTKKEIVDFTTVGLFTQEEAIVRLTQAGYGDSDARLIMKFAFGSPPPAALAGAPAVAG